MKLMISSATLVFAFVLTMLSCRYDIKKGEINMQDNEIPVEKVNFRRSNILWITK